MTRPRNLVNRASDYVSVKDFGAVGDGSTDDTAAIQAAINSLPLNTASVGVLTPKGFAQGGTIYIPRGRYKITSTITMQRGLRLVGEGREASQLISFHAAAVLKYADAGRYVQDEIVVENLSIWQDSSVTALSGAGIEVFLGPASVESVGVIIRNVYIEYTYRGVLLGAGVWCSIDNVDVYGAVLYGFDIRFTTAGTGTSTSTTSTTLKNCYASGCSTGFRIERGAYCSFVSCASDSNTNYGYLVEDGLGHSFVACGAEENGVAGVLIDGATGTIWNGFITYGTSTGTRDGIRLDGAINTTILGGAVNGVTVTAGGYGINVVVNGGNVTCIGTEFLGTFVGYETNSVYKVLMLSAQGGLVGNKNKWAIGAVQQPETDATFAVSGNLDAASNYAFKINGFHTAANANRNAAQYTQAVTDNTAVTYPLVIGSFVVNTSKGAASTITRSAGVYVQQQTQGGTANANLMLDATAGTVPAGNWSLYSDSTRDSVMKGPLRLGSAGGTAPFVFGGSGSPEGVLTAPIGSLYMRSDGGAGTSFYVKESGTGNTGWVGK